MQEADAKEDAAGAAQQTAMAAGPEDAEAAKAAAKTAAKAAKEAAERRKAKVAGLFESFVRLRTAPGDYQLRPHERVAHLLFTTHAFQSLENAFVRGQVRVCENDRVLASSTDCRRCTRSRSCSTLLCRARWVFGEVARMYHHQADTQMVEHSGHYPPDVVMRWRASAVLEPKANSKFGGALQMLSLVGPELWYALSDVRRQLEFDAEQKGELKAVWAQQPAKVGALGSATLRQQRAIERFVLCLSVAQEQKQAARAAKKGQKYVPPEERAPATFLPRLLDDFSELLLTLGAPTLAGAQPCSANASGFCGSICSAMACSVARTASPCASPRVSANTACVLSDK